MKRQPFKWLQNCLKWIGLENRIRWHLRQRKSIPVELLAKIVGFLHQA